MPRSSIRVGALLPLQRRPSFCSAHAACLLTHNIQFKQLFSLPPQLGSPRTISTSFPGRYDTIYALSTAQGQAGIAVIRVSGPGCHEVYRGLCPNKPFPKPRHAVVRTLMDPRSGSPENVLDSNALILDFPGPKSVTGEDVLELHVHGGTATVRAVLAAIPRCRSASPIRYAEPGEFTKRAFINNRLDLAQVESLSDTLAAETEQQRRAVVLGNSGSLGRTYEGWRAQLLLARGEIEALIDFSEDQHFDESPIEVLSSLKTRVADILRCIQLHEMGSQRSQLLRNGIRIVLLGPPNAGKSSLMNIIVGREASIVSDEVGTTRDVVEASLDIKGYLCSFADTAGIRAGELAATAGALGVVEQEGIRRAKQRALDSDVVVVLASVEKPEGEEEFHIHYDAETLQLSGRAQHHLVVVNKSELVSARELGLLMQEFQRNVLQKIAGLATTEPLAISCREAASWGAGATRFGGGESAVGQQQDPGQVQALVDALVHSFADMTSVPDGMQDLLGVTERQRQLLVRCRGYLDAFMREVGAGESGVKTDIVLAAEHLRLAGNCLASITGRDESSDVEAVLGVIFEKFCVGK